MMQFVYRIRLMAAVALFAAVLAACGGGSGGGGSAPLYGDGSSAPAASSVPPTTAPGAGGATSPGGAGSPDYNAPAGAPGGSGQGAAGPTGSATPDSGAATPGPANPNAERFTIVPGKSQATYHARQKVFVPGIGADVNGSTNDVTGAIDFDMQHPSRSQVDTITVHVDKLMSGISLRDQRLHNEFLESSKFPVATFKSTRLEGLPDTPVQDGQELRFKIVGDLTIHNVTREVSFDATATINGDSLTGTANTTVMLSDFGMQVPDLLNFIKAENAVGLELSITAQHA